MNRESKRIRNMYYEWKSLSRVQTSIFDKQIAIPSLRM